MRDAGSGRLPRIAVLGVLIGATITIGAWANWPLDPLGADVSADRVVVEKAARTLKLYSGGTMLRTYRISLGRAPTGPKQRAGDGRTPEGIYRLDYRKLDSSFHRALHISYPSASDSLAARERGVEPGGLIMVHGMKNGLGWVGRAHRLVDWTDGCVAVTNAEIEEIVRRVPDGTPVESRP